MLEAAYQAIGLLIFGHFCEWMLIEGGKADRVMPLKVGVVALAFMRARGII